MTVKPVSFDDLVSPLSLHKIFILLEMLDPTQCGGLECSIAISKLLDINIDRIPNDYERFLEKGFMSAERKLSAENHQWAEAIIDFFRQKHLRNAAKAYLFIDQQFIGHSADNNTATQDFLREIAQTGVPAGCV